MSNTMDTLPRDQSVKIVSNKQFDAKHIKHDPISQNNAGSKEIKNIRYDGERFYIYTPTLYCPFGISESVNKGKDGVERKSFRLATSLRGYDKYKSKQNFFQLLEKIDAAVVEEACKNSLSWLKMKPNVATEEVVHNLLNTSARFQNDDEGNHKSYTDNEGNTHEYPPLFNSNFLFYDDKFTTEVYGPNEERLETEDQIKEAINKGCNVRMIVEANKITFPLGKFGMRYTIHQVRVWPNVYESKPKGCMIDDESDEE